MPTKIKICYLQDVSKTILFEHADTCVVGRADDCRIQVPNKKKYARVSKYHCMFEINPPEVSVSDFGSMNGTFVNGEKIGQRKNWQTPENVKHDKFQAVTLKNGDIIRLDANVTLSIVIEQHAVCHYCDRPIQDVEKKECERASNSYVCSECWKMQDQKWDFMSTRTCDGLINTKDEETWDLNVGERIREKIDEAPLALGETPKVKKEESPFEIMDRIMAQHQVLKYAGLPRLQEYEIVKMLGKGGMGIVYLVEEKSTKRLYAMKVMRPDAGNDPLRTKRFLIEAENTKSLQHPHIVTFYKHDICQGCFFFIIEYCEGGSVDKLMMKNNNYLSVDTAVKIAHQALKGLEYAHQAPVKVLLKDGTIQSTTGLVHRDIKPHNLFLTSDNPDTLTTKIGDYGLSKAFQFSGLTGITGSRDGRMGSPFFLPRQYAKSIRYAEPDIDTYSIASSLYYMLTGQTPREFRRDCSPWHILLSTHPIPIKKRVMSIPDRLAELIDYALDDREELHFKTAGSFSQALAESL